MIRFRLAHLVGGCLFWLPLLLVSLLTPALIEAFGVPGVRPLMLVVRCDLLARQAAMWLLFVPAPEEIWPSPPL